MSKSLKDERFRLQAELRVKQEGFVKKERVYKAKIEVSSSNAATASCQGQRSLYTVTPLAFACTQLLGART